MTRGITIGPRAPRQRDNRFLAFVRKKPCAACGKPGPSDAAHIRMASAQYGKRYTGFGEKPDDCWCVPMCRGCHRKQHSMSEPSFWRALGKDPLGIAQELYRIGGTKPTTDKPNTKPAFGRTREAQRSATRALDRRSDIYRTA